MKKFLLWTTIFLLSPVILFVVLTILIYLPPVQNFVVQKVADYVSESTGYEVSVRHVELKFPLDLSIDDVKFIKPNDSIATQRDTIADVSQIVADVRLRPLIDGRVVVDRLDIDGAKFDTDGMVAAMRVKGSVEQIRLRSRGIEIEKEEADIDLVALSGARIDIAMLPDTLPPDTTKSEVNWVVRVAKAKVDDTAVMFHTMGDSLRLGATLNHLNITNTTIDLAKARYSVGNMSLGNSRLTYDDMMQPHVKGIDYNHLAIDSLSLKLDSIAFADPDVRMVATLATPASTLTARCNIDLTAFDKTNPGTFDIRLDAQVGKADMLRYADMPKAVAKALPNEGMTLRTCVKGNMRRTELEELKMILPRMATLAADGYAINPASPEKMRAKANMKLTTGNLSFVNAMMQPSIRKKIRIPRMTLEGTLNAEGQRYGADLTLREGRGQMKLKGQIDLPTEAYAADIDVRGLDIRHFMPRDSMKTLSAALTVKGRGYDILSPHTRLDAKATLKQFGYGYLNIDNLKAKAKIAGGMAHATVESENALADGTIAFDALMSTKRLQATLSTDLRWIDMQLLRVSEKPLAASMCAHIDIASNLKSDHKLQALLNDFTVRTEKKVYRPEDLVIDMNTTPDTTWAKAYSGNLEFLFTAKGGYETLLNQINKMADELARHKKEKIIDEQLLRQFLPTMTLHVQSGNDNPVANFMRFKGIDFATLACDLSTSPADGVQGKGHIYSMVYDSVRIDTITYCVSQDEERVNFNLMVQNNKRNPQFVFRSVMDGYLDGNMAGLNMRYYDAKNRLGLDAGVNAEMQDSGIYVRLEPYRQLLGYKSFNINKDNYLFLARNNKVSTKIDLIADDGTGIKIFSEDDDPGMLQDITMSVNRLDLEGLSSVMPYMPRIGGQLNGDFHVMIDDGERLSVVSDLNVKGLSYENYAMGNLGTEMVYLQGEGASHIVEARLMKDNDEVGLLKGTYYNDDEPAIDAVFEMNRTPLDLVNGFIPDQLFGFEGYAEGKLAIKGKTDSPVVDGEVYLDSSRLVSVPYGMKLRFDDDPVRIVGSQLLLENFTVYAHNDNPLNIMGKVDFSDLERVMVDLKMRARDYQIIGEKENNKSVAYGKAFVNIDGTIKGLIDNLVMRGKLDVLGKTDMGYILRDSPITTDNRLDELVKFCDFSDTTTVEIVRPQITGFTMDMSLYVSNGAHIMAYLNADHTNYIDLMGGGMLRMQYNMVDGIMLNGRYTLNNGKMKYSLPVIPLKTFSIQDGSYLEFHGDIMNPQLNITAEEETKATVTGTNGVGRSVKFISGIVITKTLQDMGLEFTLDAPEDLTLHNELQAMSVEQRGKLAVTMLTTGMYLADGNTESFSMNSALSSFLNSEINHITGSALRTLDLSFGIDNTTNAQGGIHTDYSFQFAKRFWNNRLKISVGGKVSTGASVESAQNSSFFDNVTFEYRLDDTANKYVTLFYNNNSYDWLDGYTQEYGAGFVWRKTIQNFRDIFRKDDDSSVPADNTKMKHGDADISEDKNEDAGSEEETTEEMNNK